MDQEGESAEHALLGEAGFGLHDCPDPVGELDVAMNRVVVSRIFPRFC